MKTIIYSPYDCLVQTTDNKFFLSLNEHLEIDEMFDTLKIYPTGKSKKYSFEVDVKETDSPFYRVIKKDDKNLIFLLDGLVAENVDIFSFEYDNNKSFVEIEKDKITFKTSAKQKIIYPPSKIKNVECGNFKHIDYVKFDGTNKKFFVAYNIFTNKTKLFQGEDIVVNENGIVITTENNNFYKKIVEEYFIDDDGLKSRSKVFLRKESFSPQLITFVFMNYIKQRDYDGAFDLLHPSLKKELPTQSLKSYFGDISYFYLIDLQTAFAISNGKNVIYEFTFADNKIIEINDNNWFYFPPLTFCLA